MGIVLYKTMFDSCGLPQLSCVKEYSSERIPLDTPEKIGQVMTGAFQLHRQTEEYVYEIAFNSKMVPLAVFEISHGTVSASLVGSREVFQKALMCGAANIVVVHNHPSGDSTPSRDDIAVANRLIEVGDLIGIPLMDFLVIGTNTFSYKGSGMMPAKEEKGGKEKNG